MAQIIFNITAENIEKIVNAHKNLPQVTICLKDLWDKIVSEYPDWTDAQIVRESIRRNEILIVKSWGDELAHMNVNTPSDNNLLV